MNSKEIQFRYGPLVINNAHTSFNSEKNKSVRLSYYNMNILHKNARGKSDIFYLFLKKRIDKSPALSNNITKIITKF